MESQNITIDPQTDFKEGKAETLSVPLENTLQRSSRIKKIHNGNDSVISGGGD